MWNAVNYFKLLNSKLKISKGEYTFCRVTGLNFLEDVLSQTQSAKAYFAVDDTDEGITIQQGGGFFNRRSVVVYILKKYDFKSQADREEKTNETRLIHKKILARLLQDSVTIPDLLYLNKTRIPYHEVPGYFSAGTTGLYFTITLDEPINLVYDATDWES